MIRDVANYLDALSSGAFEQAAWSASAAGVTFTGQLPGETGAEFLERMCANEMCGGPYVLVHHGPGFSNPVTQQTLATVQVTHAQTGHQTVMLLSTFELQRFIASLPPLAASSGPSIADVLFPSDAPERVVIERFNAVEVIEGGRSSWHTHPLANQIQDIQRDIVLTFEGLTTLTDPQATSTLRCPRLVERDGTVLVVDGCSRLEWHVVEAATRAEVAAATPMTNAPEGGGPWFTERGGVTLSGFYDAEGNHTTIFNEDGIDLLRGDYASQVVLSTDGRHIAYVEHRSPPDAGPHYSPRLVVRDTETGAEAGRWTLQGPILCVEFDTTWLAVCEGDSDPTNSAPEQTALVSINLYTGDQHRSQVRTKLFLPGN